MPSARRQPAATPRPSACHLLFSFLLLAVLTSRALCEDVPAPPSEGFSPGEHVPIECHDVATGEWTEGIRCHETGKMFAVKFGVNSFRDCGVRLGNASAFAALVALVRRETAWHCRVPVGKGASLYVPLTLPLWGFVDAGAVVRLNNRMDFAFHTAGGLIVGAAAYPVWDRFVASRQGSVVPMHGAVRWLRLGSPSGGAAGGGGGCGLEGGLVLVAVASSSVTAMAVLLSAALLYERKLKPAIIRKCLKKA